MKNKKLILIIVIIALAIVAGVIGFTLSKKQTASPSEPSKTEATEKKQKKSDEKDEKDEKDESWSVWTTDRVKLREQPSSEAEILTVLEAGTELTATAEEEGWLKVSYDDKNGYVSKEFTTIDKPETEEKSQTETKHTGGYVICLDPGHQRSGDSTPEPNGPGSGTTKARVTGGTTGRTTGVPEYELNLTIALKLQQELQARGYTVYMTRTSNDVNISNKERAEYATSVGADITVRIHANGSDNTGVSGALAIVPSSGNAYVGNLAAASQQLGQCILNAYCAATGMANQGVQANDTMTGINWCTMPVTIIEMGYMTNPNDDVNMQDASFQQKMVTGMANGIDAYFGNE